MQAPLKPEIIASSHPPLFTLSVYEWTSGVTEQQQQSDSLYVSPFSLSTSDGDSILPHLRLASAF